MDRACCFCTLLCLLLTVGPVLGRGGDEQPPAPTYDTTPVIPVGASSTPCALSLLIDKAEIYGGALDMMRAAEREILFNIFLLGGTDNTFTEPPGYVGIGKAIVDVMAEKLEEAANAGRPFTVRLITPEPGGSIGRQKEIQAKVETWRNRIRRLVGKDPLPGPVEPGYKPSYGYAVERGLPVLGSNVAVFSEMSDVKVKLDHNKILVVDGKEALIGGSNFSEATSTNHDAVVQVAGPMVQELKAIFTNCWYYAVQQAEARDETVPDEWKDYEGLARTDEDELLGHFEKRLAEGWHRATARLTLTAPYRRDTKQRLVRLLSSTTAGDTVRVALLYLTDEDCTEALALAHERGVEVKVLLDPNVELYHVPSHGAPNLLAAYRLIKRGVDVRNFTVNPGQKLHLKLLIVERASGAIEFAMGSTNWTAGSFASNYELLVFFDECPGVGRRLVECFDGAYEDRSHLPGRPKKKWHLGCKDETETERKRRFTLIQRLLMVYSKMKLDEIF